MMFCHLKENFLTDICIFFCGKFHFPAFLILGCVDRDLLDPLDLSKQNTDLVLISFDKK